MAVNLATLLASAERLPTPPAVALELLALAQREDADVDKMAAVISRDPALVSKILRVANTPLFGARKVATIKQALMTLGLRAVQVMALSFSLVRPAGGDTSDEESAFWRNSLTSAVAARILAAHWAPRQADECFVAGLLCDIGVMTAKLAWPDKAAPLLARMRERRDDGLEAERMALGADHMALGSALLRNWSLPAPICDAVACHHQLEALEATAPAATRNLTNVVAIAAIIERCFRNELVDKDEEQLRADLDLVRRRLAASFGASDDDVSLIFQEIRKGRREMAAVFDVNLGDPRTLDEIQVRTSQVLVSLSASMASRMGDLERKTETLATQAAQDGLTGLANRRELETRSAERFAAARAKRSPYAVLMIDLDHFKQVNDTHGHQVGDDLLQALGEALRKGARENELFARYGGEEFCALLPCADEATLRTRAVELLAAIRSLAIALPSGATLSPTASIGGAFVPDANGAASPEAVREAADRCLYDSKKAGRDRATVLTLAPGASCGSCGAVPPAPVAKVPAPAAPRSSAPPPAASPTAAPRPALRPTVRPDVPPPPEAPARSPLRPLSSPKRP
ncbi:MAG: GGDEF domain-containing protein [Planctomycetes bacterium]|nr:GGDEF domain-containing protein [Planctomycetota bacterium]